MAVADEAVRVRESCCADRQTTEIARRHPNRSHFDDLAVPAPKFSSRGSAPHPARAAALDPVIFHTSSCFCCTYWERD